METELLRLFDRSWERGEDYVPAVRLALKGVLVAPDFLFLPEPEPEGGGVQPLPPAALAMPIVVFPLVFDARRRVAGAR